MVLVLIVFFLFYILQKLEKITDNKCTFDFKVDILPLIYVPTLNYHMLCCINTPQQQIILENRIGRIHAGNLVISVIMHHKMYFWLEYATLQGTA